MATLFWISGATGAVACTMSSSSVERPEIEIEIDFEDYDDVSNRVFYTIEIEADVVPPEQTAECQCGLAVGPGGGFSVPDSFDVYGAFVGLRSDDGDGDFDLAAFGEFQDDPRVSNDFVALPGFDLEGTAHGFSMDVSPFELPNAGAGDKFVLGFRIGFDPSDFEAVDGSPIRFAAGSDEPGHLLTMFQGYQQTLNLPAFRVDECDLNADFICDAADLDLMLSLGRLADGVPRVDATEVYDLNGDDQIDLQDVADFLEKAADHNGFDEPYDYGDTDLDGDVDAQDLNALALHWQSTSSQWSDGDFSGDWSVDSTDLNQLAMSWQHAIPSKALVPEPDAPVGVYVLGLLLAVKFVRHGPLR